MKESLQAELQKIIEQYAKQRKLDLPAGFQAEVDFSRDPTHGDFSSAVAFRLAKFWRDSPERIAQDIVSHFESSRIVKHAEVAGSGFLNFYLPSVSRAQVLVDIHKKDSQFGQSEFGKGKKILIEFVSANPTGPLTIAHGRQAALGDSLARILRSTGHNVETEYYLNDAGRQMNLLGESLWARYAEQLGKPLALPEEGYQGAYLVDIAKLLVKSRGDGLLKIPKPEAVDFCRRFAAEEIMKGIRQDLEKIRVSFDGYFNESSLYRDKAVEQTLDLLSKRGHLFESEGALWFRSTSYKDDKDRVIRKSSGEYTYLAPDIAYHQKKFERGFDTLINLWGPDHHGYVPRLKASCQALGHDPEQVKILIVQLVTLFRKGQPVRMSTRAGEFVTLRELFEEVGVDATRFFFLLRRVESHLDFDLDLAKTQSDENPVYYLQYAHARISSILKFAKRKIDTNVKLERLEAGEESELLKKLYEYPQILIQASQALEPYRVVEYLRDLAAQFHKFYALHRVVTEDEELTRARLLLVDGVRIVLRNGLAVLGISHPETM